MQLLGEEINTEVAVLTSLSGGGDTDDLAWATLEDQQITDADVMAWNGDGVWHAGWAGGGAVLPLARVTWCRHFDVAFTDSDVLLTSLNTGLAVVMVVVTLVVALEWVEDAVGGTVETVTE